MKFADEIQKLQELHSNGALTDEDHASLEKTCRENMERNRANDGMLKKLAGDVLVDVSFERKNYFLFSIGTVKTRLRLGDSVGASRSSIPVVVPIACVGYFQRFPNCQIRQPTPTYPPALSA